MDPGVVSLSSFSLESFIRFQSGVGWGGSHPKSWLELGDPVLGGSRMWLAIGKGLNPPPWGLLHGDTRTSSWHGGGVPPRPNDTRVQDWTAVPGMPQPWKSYFISSTAFITTQVSLPQCGRRVHKGRSSRRQGSLGALLEAAYHTSNKLPFVNSIKKYQNLPWLV